MSPLPAAGDAGPAFEMPVELGKVREFAAATKARHASYSRGGDAPLVVPPMFLTTAVWWLPESGSVLAPLADDWSRLLHGGQRYTFHGPPPVSGDHLVARQRIFEVTEREGRRAGPMTFIDWGTEFAGADGEVRAVERHLTILTSRSPEPPEPTTSAAGAGDESGRPVDADRLADFVDDPVSMTDIVRYQGASGDLNPIHHDHELARANGYSGAFSVGMLHAGILGSHVATVFAPENVREVGVRFREQMWPGDRLTYGGRVVGRREVAGERLLELHLEVRRHDGGVPLTGDALVADPHQ